MIKSRVKLCISNITNSIESLASIGVINDETRATWPIQKTKRVSFFDDEIERLPQAISNTIFTAAAKAELAERFTNGYIAGPGFNDDIDAVKRGMESFLANPSQFRPNFTSLPFSADRGGQTLHTTALYAYAMDDVYVANVVAAELFAIVRENDLHTSYWNDSFTRRWDVDDNLHVISTKFKKMKTSFSLIKNLQSTLNESEKNEIDNWFVRMMHLAFAGFKTRMENAFLGENWDEDNINRGYFTGDLYPSQHGNPHPIQDRDGNNIIAVTHVQDFFNNRWWDIVSFIHSA